MSWIWAVILTPFGLWVALFAAGVRAVLRTVWLVSALPLDQCGELRILRTKFIPVALHDIEASLLSQSGYLRLRAAFVRAFWSGNLTMAHTGTVLVGLRGWIQVSVLSGFGSACCAGALLTDQMRLLGLDDSWS